MERVPFVRFTDLILQDLIHISEAKMGRKLVDWYIRNLSRTYA
jgi:hypothetical protein